jgi:transposase
MIFGVDRATKVFLYGKPCDMRKGFDGLYGLVQNEMELNPLSGYIFVFISKYRNKVKLLYWDQDGLVLYYKRLEKGTFKRPSANVNAPNSELSHEDIYMILRGIDFENTKKRKRYLTTKNC